MFKILLLLAVTSCMKMNFSTKEKSSSNASNSNASDSKPISDPRPPNGPYESSDIHTGAYNTRYNLGDGWSFNHGKDDQGRSGFGFSKTVQFSSNGKK